MKKRNFYFLGLSILFISVICSFWSCKSYNSSLDAIVEETTDGKCSYVYPKSDENYEIVYCFTECKECPSDTDINDFNVSKEGKEKLSNELCPLTEENTHYIYMSRIPNTITNYIGITSDLRLKKLDQGFETVYEDITTNKAINVDPNDIDNNRKISDMCSRDFLFAKYNDKSSSVGTIIRRDRTSRSISPEEEYGYGIYTTSFQFKYYGLTRAENGNPTKLWWFSSPSTSKKSTDDPISLEKYLNAPGDNSSLLEYFKNVAVL